ncbi:MAG: PhzF family phenazine biosynthesis protein [Bacteroidota bacterium]|nr:PhzF family phenazine biosynthesis protein [Bacteroidota bacterium]
MNLAIYQIDAFTDTLFSGNPAAVIPLDHWLDATLMQQIAFENNLSETVFFVPAAQDSGSDFEIRWFTPEVEINLCGHATLAASYVIFQILGLNKDSLVFQSQSGPLKVRKNGDLFEMDFPSWKPSECNNPPVNLRSALGGAEIISLSKSRDLLVELPNEKEVRECMPDFSQILQTGYKIIVTARGDQVDFVSRFFAPTAGINEDPVTGSAHSQLIPFWSEKLQKEKMTALQLSRRGGKIFCAQRGDRVMMSGTCVFYMKGEIEIK